MRTSLSSELRTVLSFAVHFEVQKNQQKHLDIELSQSQTLWAFEIEMTPYSLLWVCSLHQGKDLFSRLRTGYLPAKRPCEWDWDAAAQRPRQRPRLDYVPQLIWNRSCLQASKEQRRG